MSAVVVIGEADRVEAFALAGAVVMIAADPGAVRDAWESLTDDVGLVVLSATASAVLGDARAERSSVLVAAMPA